MSETRNLAWNPLFKSQLRATHRWRAVLKSLWVKRHVAEEWQIHAALTGGADAVMMNNKGLRQG